MNEDATGSFGGAAAGLTPEGLPFVFGGYRIIRLLGQGGMGAVYLAEQQHPRRSVALKVIKPGAGRDEILKRFELEADLLGRLQHPAVAQVYEAGTADTSLGSCPFFAMEYISGDTLRRFAASQALTTRQRLELIARVCDGVHHAHQRGVIHRDLKPGNILVDDTGQPKILDFGVARVTEPDVQATQQTATGQIIGTLAYMSPEQVSGQSHLVDIRCDVYALGVILYELLASRLPVAVENKPLHLAIEDICEQDPATLSSVSREYRGDIETIVGKALEKERDRRYSSAAELAADLRRHLDDEPIVARPASVVYQLTKFARRHTAVVVAAALVFAVLVLGASISTWQAVRARRAEAAAQRRFNDMRTVAGTLLFDLHDAVRDLAGSIPARRLVLDKAQEYLEILARESAGDVPLQRDLVVAYDRIGDLLGNPAMPNIGNAAAALESYRKGLELATTLSQQDGSDLVAQRERASLTSKLGDMAFGSGDLKGAIARHQDALALAAGLPADERSKEIHAAIQQRLCSLRPAVGDAAGAVQACRDSIALLQPLLDSDPSNRLHQRMMAVSLGGLGNVLRATGKPADALPHLRRAESLFDALSNSDPANGDYSRQVANMSVYLAPALEQTGDVKGALAAFERAVTILGQLLPRESEDSRIRTVLGSILMRYSALLHKSGDQPRARAMTARSLEVQEPLIDRPNVAPTVLNEYANTLLKSEYAELHDSAKALAIMLKVDKVSNGSNPIFLDTLAWAYYRTGDPQKALDTARKALSVLAPGPSGLRTEIDQSVAEFEKARRR